MEDCPIVFAPHGQTFCHHIVSYIIVSSTEWNITHSFSQVSCFLSFVGHGVCDHLTKSCTFPLATDEPKQIYLECCAILRAQAAPVADLRGVRCALGSASYQCWSWAFATATVWRFLLSDGYTVKSAGGTTRQGLIRGRTEHPAVCHGPEEAEWNQCRQRPSTADGEASGSASGWGTKVELVSLGQHYGAN